jgi:hypothetical protein
MSTHTGLPVSGYQPQSDDAVEAVNYHKEMEERLLRRIDELMAASNAGVVGLPACDIRWLAIAKTHTELAFMALNRAVFQPGRIKLPGER